MQKYEVEETPAGRSITAKGSTRAGLAIAALQGLFAAQQPATVASEKAAQDKERLFTLSGSSFGELLGKLLSGALEQSAKNGEMYNHFRFDLITDREAKGAYVGHGVEAFAAPATAVAVDAAGVRRTEDGSWQATITITS